MFTFDMIQILKFKQSNNFLDINIIIFITFRDRIDAQSDANAFYFVNFSMGKTFKKTMQYLRN